MEEICSLKTSVDFPPLYTGLYPRRVNSSFLPLWEHETYNLWRS
jgi:hypothetical protein